MNTTIQISDHTLHLLKELKKSFHMKTYDEVINKLVHKEVPISMFGAHPEMKSFTQEDEAEFEGEQHEL